MTRIALIVGSLNRPSLNRSAAEYIAAQAPTGVQIEEIAIYAVIPVQSGMTPFRQNPGICKGFKPANQTGKRKTSSLKAGFPFSGCFFAALRLLHQQLADILRRQHAADVFRLPRGLHGGGNRGAGGIEHRLIVDFALRFLAAGVFERGAQAGKQHVAAQFVRPSIGAGKVEQMHVQFVVGKIGRAADENMHFVETLVVQKLRQQDSAGGADNVCFHALPLRWISGCLKVGSGKR